MKITAFLLAFLMTTVMLSPCTDGDDHEQKDAVSVVNTDFDGEEDHQDYCSPFCACQCCHTHITKMYGLQITELPKLSETSIEYSIDLHNRIAFSIWDPPQSV